MKKVVAILVALIMVVAVIPVSYAEYYEFEDLEIKGGASQATITGKTRNEVNTLDLKAEDIDWNNVPSNQRDPKFRGYYSGTGTTCTYAKTIIEGRYRKATYTTSTMYISVDILMSIKSSNSNHKIYISGYGRV